jgi:S-adenosylmethionine-diacylglycerol 3-amino-3-carboxypropyl transferase
MNDKKSPGHDGVQLDELIFTLSWEDPALDVEALPVSSNTRIATVASGGCNALTFLLHDPQFVYAFDYNLTQVWTLQLKVAAFRTLEHDAVLELFGVRQSDRRRVLVETAVKELAPGARQYWLGRDDLVQNGLLGLGRYERFVRAFRTLLRLIQGRGRIETLFDERDQPARVEFFENTWNSWAWRLLFKAFFNKTVLSRRGLSPEYFTFDDGSTSFADSFAGRTRHALTELSVRDNPFLAQYTRGAYLDEEHLPDYLREENFDLLRTRLDRLVVEQNDVRSLVECYGPSAFDGICLSNVFELMSEAETQDVLQKLAPCLVPGGRMTLRNLMIPRAVQGDLASQLVLDEPLSRALLLKDRSFVYRSFQVYTYQPDEFEPASRKVANA